MVTARYRFVGKQILTNKRVELETRQLQEVFTKTSIENCVGDLYVVNMANHPRKIAKVYGSFAERVTHSEKN